MSGVYDATYYVLYGMYCNVCFSFTCVPTAVDPEGLIRSHQVSSGLILECKSARVATRDAAEVTSGATEVLLRHMATVSTRELGVTFRNP